MIEILKKITDFRWVYRFGEKLRVCRFTGKIEYLDRNTEWQNVLTDDYVGFIQEEMEDEREAYEQQILDN